MNFLVVYCTHQTAELAVRERLAFSSRERLDAAYAELQQRFAGVEAVVLSTCNRVELYFAWAENDGPSAEAVHQFLADFHQIPTTEFAFELRHESGQAVVRHLFEVVSSLDSMVLGEPQIVSQVKEAYRTAEENSACGPRIHALFQSAIRVSGRVRTETGLAEGRVSIASVAVGDFAKSIFDHFADKQVLVIGAGEMAEETLRYLKDEGVRDLVVVNRSPERAERLAAEWGGVPAPWEDLDRWLGQADVIVSTTGANRPVVDRARFQAARATGSLKPAIILDLGAPRDFDPAVGTLEDVFLYDIDSLARTCDANRRARSREIERARTIIVEETAQFTADINRRAGGDLVTRLREGWHEVSRQELERMFKKLPHLEGRDREAIERAVERIVNKLLHPPLEALRDESKDGAPHGLLNALRRLFHLP